MAAQPIPSLMTADEFIRVYGEGDEDRYELIDGTVCEGPLNGYRSGVDRLGFEWLD